MAFTSAVVKSIGNSSTVSLGASGAFTGVAENISEYQETSLHIYATPSTAAGTLYFEFSVDGTNWDVSVPVTISDPTTYPPVPLRVVLPYFRVRYVNDGIAQTAMRLTTMYHRTAAKHVTRFGYQEFSVYEPIERVAGIDIMLSIASGTANAAGNNTIITPASGKKVEPHFLMYNLEATNTVFWRFGAAGTGFILANLPKDSTISKSIDHVNLRLRGAVDAPLILNLANASNVNYTVFYIEV